MASMGIKNALTVDVEDWFHVSLFRHKIRRDEWEQMKPTVVENTCRVLNLFARKNVKATFFVLGWVAERYPEIVTTIKAFGHEIASHGYGHQIVYEPSREEFHDLRRMGIDLEFVAYGKDHTMLLEELQDIAGWVRGRMI